MSNNNTSEDEELFPRPKFSIWGEAWMMWCNRPTKVIILSISQVACYERKPILRERAAVLRYGVNNYDQGFTISPHFIKEEEIFPTKDELLDSL